MTFLLRVHGIDATIPAGKIVCIGKNYADHAREMGGIAPAEPFFFLKPASALVPSGGSIAIPAGITNVQHEAELAVIIGARAKRVTREDALDIVYGYAAFLDITARDLQVDAKRDGRPWSLAKGMDTFAPIGDIARTADVKDPDALAIRLDVNGERRQTGNTADMVHAIADLIVAVTRHVTLEPGDILATGTPAGVAALRPGDQLELVIEGLPALNVDVITTD